MGRRSGSRAPSRWGPRWSRWVGRFLARVLWRTEVRGRGLLPRRGPVILVANHVGFIDGPVVHGVVPRRSHFLVKEAMFKGPLGVVLRAAGQIEVDDSGREALARGLAVLRRGDVVGVFPEGARGSGTAENIHGGAAWLAAQSGAPVMPVALFGTRHTGEPVGLWPKPGRRILCVFGEPAPLDLDPALRGRERQAAAAAQVAERLRAHLAAAAATTDLRLPQDDPLRERARQSGQGEAAGG